MTIMVGQAGVAAAASGVETVSLSGTLGTPIVFGSVAPFNLDAKGVWLFGTVAVPSQSIERGQTQRATFFLGTPNFISVNTGSDWVIPNNFLKSYWIRAQHDTTPPSVAPNFDVSIATNPIGTADAPGDWLTLINGGTDRHWGWIEVNNISTTEGIIKIEISTTQSEAGILATGFYRGVARVETP